MCIRDRGKRAERTTRPPETWRAATHPEPVRKHQSQHGIPDNDTGSAEYSDLLHQPDEGEQKVPSRRVRTFSLINRRAGRYAFSSREMPCFISRDDLFYPARWIFLPYGTNISVPQGECFRLTKRISSSHGADSVYSQKKKKEHTCMLFLPKANYCLGFI